MSLMAQSAGDPFDAGPFRWVPPVLPFSSRSSEHGPRCAVVAVLIGWLPLPLLAWLDHPSVYTSPHESVWLDAGEIARYLIAAPTLAFAGAVILPRLARVVSEFVTSEIIRDEDRRPYREIVDTARHLILNRWVDLGLVAVAYTMSIALSSSHYPPDVSTWVSVPLPDGGVRLTLAGWWRGLISQPLLNILLGIWLWRIVVWAWFLSRVRRFQLRLVAGHPDGLGGLRFLLVPLRGFTVLAFAIGAMAAGAVAQSVLVDRVPLQQFRYVIGAQVVMVLVVFAGPLLFLSAPLMRLKERATFEYGRLASDLGHAFEEHWVAKREPSPFAGALKEPDFSATTDLFSIVERISGINPFMVTPRAAGLLAIATLLPYLPLLLAIIPIDEIVQFAVKALV